MSDFYGRGRGDDAYFSYFFSGGKNYAPILVHDSSYLLNVMVLNLFCWVSGNYFGGKVGGGVNTLKTFGNIKLFEVIHEINRFYLFREHIPDIFICAGYSAGGKDSCEVILIFKFMYFIIVPNKINYLMQNGFKPALMNKFLTMMVYRTCPLDWNFSKILKNFQFTISDGIKFSGRLRRTDDSSARGWKIPIGGSYQLGHW